jgi:parallel beta-helix repeat protein
MKKRFYTLFVILLALCFSSVLSINAQEIKRTVIVSTIADSGDGSLRSALDRARPGDYITFDSQVFPVDNPTRILLESQLPVLDTGTITINGTGAGVILDGSHLGSLAEAGFMDDIQLLTDEGENLISNGDFQDGLNHWILWQLEDLGIARWTGDEGAENDGAAELAPSSRSSEIVLAYNDNNETKNLFGSGNHPSGSAPRIQVEDSKRLTLFFQHKQIDLGIVIQISNEDGSSTFDVYDYGVDFSSSWAQSIYEFDVPDGATGFFITFNIYPSDFHHGLVIESNDNVIQGLQIENFPGDAIFLSGASRNQIGGARQSMNAACISPCNLLSGNIGSGVFIEGGAENVVQGNLIGVDIGGENAQANGVNGVRLFATDGNLIGGDGGEGNILGTNSMNIEINDGASFNEIRGNFVGVDISGEMPLGSDHAGLSLAFNAHDNIIENNVISGNEIGIAIANESHHNQVLNNFIGTDLSHSLTLSNQSGIQISNDAYDNKIGPGNYILFNRDTGVYVAGSETTGNRITQNTIEYNQGSQVVVDALADDWISAPTRFTATTREISGFSQPNSDVEVYISDGGDGGEYIKTITTDEIGAFKATFSEGEIKGKYITILAFDLDGTTSEFAASLEPEELPFRAPPGLIRPENISKDIRVISVNAFLAIFTLVYVGLGSTYFNETLENYPDEIEALVILPAKKLIARIIPWKEKRIQEYDLKRVLLSWLLILLIISAIQSLLDVETLFTINQIALIWTLFLGGLVVSGLQALGELVMRKSFKNTAKIEQAKVGWPATILAGISTLLSLAFHLVPGLMLGAVDTFFLKPDLEDDRLNAWRALITKSTVLGITFLGWWFYSASAGKAMPLLETFFIVGLQYAFFELMPFDVLDGAVLLQQKKWSWYIAWGLLMGLTSFGMFHLALNPNSSDVRDIMQSSANSLAWIFALLGIAVISMRWAIASYRKEKFEMTHAAWGTVAFVVIFLFVSLLVQFGVIENIGNLR